MSHRWLQTAAACSLALAGAMAAPTRDAFLFRDSFENGLGSWRPQGSALRVSVEKSDHDADNMLRLDNSAGKEQAFLGVQAGPASCLLRFSFFARSGLPQPGKAGLHRYAGPIKWVDVGRDWTPVS